MKQTKTARKRSAVISRSLLMHALVYADGMQGKLRDAMKLIEHEPAMNDLVVAVKALRTIANAPDGTPGLNLKGVARSALKGISLPVKEDRDA
jgi:hypothetical protein